MTRLWPVPACAVLFALVLGLVLPELDSRVDGRVSGRARAWMFGGDADAARSLLDAIASSLITVTALTFSLTVVTLQLASSQFSPRLLRTFSRDHVVQATLALLLATFTYCLTVLRAVRNGDEAGAEVVPRLATSLAYVLAVASVLALVLFLGHLTRQIRVETMLDDVRGDASRTVRAVLPQRRKAAGPVAVPLAPPDACEVRVRDEGFVTRIDHDRLLKVAVDEGVVLQLAVSAGRFLVKETPIGLAWSMSGSALEGEGMKRVAAGTAACVHTGSERTATQDVGFGLRQLVDVAIKALSPGINDPTTAVHALGHVSSLLCELADRDLGPTLLRDDDDEVRVILHQPDLSTYITLGVSQPRRYGAGDPQVLEGVARVLLDLSRRDLPEVCSIITEELMLLRWTADAQAFDPAERRGLDALIHQIEHQMSSVEVRGPI